ncbi:MAG: type I phosphomannose isomerase catalytic subunit [Planctomycetota bacterium]
MSNELLNSDVNVLRFSPLLKQTIWGGRKLGDLLNKSLGDADDYAESWEIVDHGVDQSIVVDGPLQGSSLSDLFQSRTGWLMGDAWTAANSDAKTFPLLLKFLDCNRVLSVQVHPDDEYGATMDPPDLGKTEAWVVLHAEPGALIYAGLQPGVSREELAARIESGETESVLHSFSPEVGDCVFIPAGTVHALGEGLVIAEIQQSSDTTFRLFDWNRVDSSGKSRPLHIDASLDVTDYAQGPVRAVDPVLVTEHPRRELLVRCDQFELVRCTIPEGETATIGGSGGCQLITVVEGAMTIEGRVWSTGDSGLCPAGGESVQVVAKSPSVFLWMKP